MSSQHNKIYFWNILSSDSRGLASFRATQDRTDTVLAIHIDSNEETLVVGDTGGNVSIWDITSYCVPDVIPVGDVTCRLSYVIKFLRPYLK